MEQISFHRLARRELIDAALFYDVESPGLGAAFLDEVEDCTRNLLAFPESGQVVRGGVRRRLLRRFPYALLYSLKKDTIRVLAVMNLKRRPLYWVGRE
ncbi:type II toxin-antitoxin system RelE/ParE family toxin [Nitrospira tepida]|uniref:type II toxin-antitoxin system RelE/ParE family toxin n=1 Tax=Nitrospira tepida TaxID=2973512 RepID=UPI00351E4A79